MPVFKALFSSVMALAAISTSNAAMAEAFPSRPITVILPYTAGGQRIRRDSV